MISTLMAVLVVMLLVLMLYVAFLHGRNYERKQFVRIGHKKRPTVQDVVLKRGK